MPTLKIISATNYDKKKDGLPIVDRKGRPQYRSVIKAEGYQDFLTGFVYDPLQAGQEIEAKIEIGDYLGKPQYRFTQETDAGKVAQSAQGTNETMIELKNQTAILGKILDKLEGVYMSISTHQTINAIKSKHVEIPPIDSMDFDIGDLPTDAHEVLSEDDFGDPFGSAR